MKKIVQIFLIALTVLATATSCEDGENAIDTLQAGVDTSGAVLRTLVAPADLVTLTGDNNSVDITIEVQEGDGSVSTFTEVRVFVKLYQDQDLLLPTVDSNGNELSETLIMTLPSSIFTLSEINNLPSTEILMPTPTILAAFAADAQITVPTFIATRLELELADGRVFTNTNVAATIATGAYFASPFLYKTIFINN